ncbi:TetR family transcriptional regulator [Microbulbifer sp. TRSA002]|uniref:TetR family transcriptional regulator n=1 Tax=Microbulbifer sp. TRSA002 TaxID=3243382 RepID=UPI00403A343D
MKFQRARSEAQIEQRQQNILKTARELCIEFGVLKWSLNELGRRSSVTKSNLYRYFGSREEVLMHLFAIELESLTCSLEQLMGEGRSNVESVSKVIAAQYGERPLFCELLSISASILEHNIDVECNRQFKQSMQKTILRHANALKVSLEWISDDRAFWVARVIFTFTAGLWPVANSMLPLSRPQETSRLDNDFENQLYEFVSLLLSGCRAEAR